MAQVKLILREAVVGLGEAGTLVSVKPGYARNFLLPQGKALLATEGKVNELEHQRRVVAEQAARDRKDLESLRDRLQSLSLEVSARVGEEGKLFGSVTSSNIAELIAAKGYEIDRRKIVLDEPLKEVGEHKIPIRLAGDVIAEVGITISEES
jgi:large subunit ribosomal protein L9